MAQPRAAARGHLAIEPGVRPHTQDPGGVFLGPLLAFSRGVDALNAAFGRIADWLVLIACTVSAVNAFARYGFSSGSNAWLEAQWYAFAGMVMLGASYTLFRNEHVRVDLVYGALGQRARIWVDVFGITLFLMPAMALLAWMTWPFFVESFVRAEVSPAPGGLIRWPVKLLLPLGFLLMSLQGLSELVKRIAMLRGIELPPGRLHASYARPDQ
jgi:TRAP-type mannitol/chloroaromatic compound transport system permease small subunit